MVDFLSDASRSVTAHVVNHQSGSNAFKAHGPKSLGLKEPKDGSGFPANTQDECVAIAEKLFRASKAHKIPCSGIFFAYLAENNEGQPNDLETQIEAFRYGIKHDMDCWLSRRGKITVGTNSTGKKRRTVRPKRELSKSDSAAIASFLKD